MAGIIRGLRFDLYVASIDLLLFTPCLLRYPHDNLLRSHENSMSDREGTL